MVAFFSIKFCGGLYRQCDGIDFRGDKCCAPNLFCVRKDPWFSQCLDTPTKAGWPEDAPPPNPIPAPLPSLVPALPPPVEIPVPVPSIQIPQPAPSIQIPVPIPANLPSILTSPTRISSAVQSERQSKPLETSQISIQETQKAPLASSTLPLSIEVSTSSTGLAQDPSNDSTAMAVIIAFSVFFALFAGFSAYFLIQRYKRRRNAKRLWNQIAE